MARDDHGGARLLEAQARLLAGRVLLLDPPDASALRELDRWSSRAPTLPPAGDWDTAALFLPKGRRRQRLMFALAAERAPRLVVVGDKRSGIKSAKKELRALGRVVGQAHGHHHQLVAVEPTQRDPVDLSAWEQRFEVEGARFVSLPGVFADGRLDEASALLLEAVPAAEVEGCRVLDVGCGAGVLGATFARRGAAEVVLTDVDAFALESARRNTSELSVSVRFSDVYEGLAGERFDRIVTNPPFHQGVATEYDTTRRLIANAGEHLRPGGALVLVANRFLPWREPLEAAFAKVEVLRETSRFVVWRAG